MKIVEFLLEEKVTKKRKENNKKNNKKINKKREERNKNKKNKKRKKKKKKKRMNSRPFPFGLTKRYILVFCSPILLFRNSISQSCIFTHPFNNQLSPTIHTPPLYSYPSI